MTTSSSYPAAAIIPAERAELIRPCDLAAHQALHQLARMAHARIRRGAVRLVGRDWPAWLAIAGDGRVLVAVLTRESEDGA